jgi:hypothetical protein
MCNSLVEDEQQLNRIKDIFEVFELKAYSAYEPFPSNELRHFGPLQYRTK